MKDHDICALTVLHEAVCHIIEKSEKQGQMRIIAFQVKLNRTGAW